MRVLWTHNFDPAQPNSQVYMSTAAAGVRALGVDLHLEYLGNLRSIPNLLRARRRVRRASRGFDLVHAQYGSACALATAAADAVPKVLSIRGNDWTVHAGTSGFFYVHTRLARAMTRAALGAYDAVIAVSRRLASELTAAAPRVAVSTVPSPVDLDCFVPRDKAEARSLLGHPGSTEKWVLFTALRLDDPIKRFPLAQEAAAIAQAARGDVRLRIASTLPHADIPLFVAACDVILCTSETEGWPNSVKEALACNVPFVSTDVSDLRDIAAREPSCRVCPPDPRILAENMCQVLASGMRTDLRRHVVGMGLGATSDRLIEIYQAVLARRHGADAALTASGG